MCASHWHRLDPARADGLVATARLLLDAGADPAGSIRGARGGVWTPLRCAVAGAANPAIVRLLLDRGDRARPGPGAYRRARGTGWKRRPGSPKQRCPVRNLIVDAGVALEMTWTAISRRLRLLGDQQAVAERPVGDRPPDQIHITDDGVCVDSGCCESACA